MSTADKVQMRYDLKSQDIRPTCEEVNYVRSSCGKPTKISNKRD